MVKILSQAGNSLADMYDVVGSVAGIDQLETQELGIVHEMGATVFSERFRISTRRLETIATAQSLAFSAEITDLPDGVSRILGIQVFADNGARVSTAQLSINDPIAERDFPLWVYDNVGGAEFRQARIEDDGTLVNRDFLMPILGPSTVPCFVTNGQSEREPEVIALRGLTTAFGAGTVTLFALVNLAFTFTGGVSARGARVPSW